MKKLITITLLLTSLSSFASDCILSPEDIITDRITKIDGTIISDKTCISAVEEGINTFNDNFYKIIDKESVNKFAIDYQVKNPGLSEKEAIDYVSNKVYLDYLNNSVFFVNDFIKFSNLNKNKKTYNPEVSMKKYLSKNQLKLNQNLKGILG